MLKDNAILKLKWSAVISVCESVCVCVSVFPSNTLEHTGTVTNTSGTQRVSSTNTLTLLNQDSFTGEKRKEGVREIKWKQDYFSVSSVVLSTNTFFRKQDFRSSVIWLLQELHLDLGMFPLVLENETGRASRFAVCTDDHFQCSCVCRVGFPALKLF